MSTLGSDEVLERARFEHCIDLARNVRTKTTGKWIFKTSTVSGLTEFHRARSDPLRWGRTDAEEPRRPLHRRPLIH